MACADLGARRVPVSHAGVAGRWPSRRPGACGRVAAGPTGLEALEAAMGLISKIVSRQAQQPRTPGRKGGDAAAAGPKKLVRARVRTKSSRDVAETLVAPDQRPLRAYLSLPLEEYSVLDPRWVRRLRAGRSSGAALAEEMAGAAAEAGAAAAAATTTAGGAAPAAVAPVPAGSSAAPPGEGSADRSASAMGAGEAGVPSAAAPSADAPDAAACDAFLLTVPLQELVGLPLTPQIVVRVAVDAQKGRTTFSSDTIKLGDPRLDSEFEITVQASVASAVTRAAHKPPAAAPSTTEADAGATTTDGASAARTEQTDDAVVGSAPSALLQRSKLRAEVDMHVVVRVPPPLSVVPGPLLSATGGLIMRLVLQSLLPSFLDLLAVDYSRWAAGSSTSTRQSRAAGSLWAAAAAQHTPVGTQQASQKQAD